MALPENGRRWNSTLKRFFLIFRREGHPEDARDAPGADFMKLQFFILEFFILELSILLIFNWHKFSSLCYSQNLFQYICMHR
jgi:hypothetical protein